MSHAWKRSLMMAGLAACLFPSSAGAIEKCKVKVDKQTGTILFSASSVTGSLTWGTDAGDEFRSFFDPACLTPGTAKGCTLADPATLAAKTPPAGCTLYAADMSSSCSTWISGCTPREDVRVRATNSFAVSPGIAGLLMPFDTERWDTSGMHDTAVNNSEFVIPIDGNYAMTAHISSGVSHPSNVQVCLLVNGLDINGAIACTASSGNLNFNNNSSTATVTHLNAGDIVRVQVAETVVGNTVQNRGGQYGCDLSIVKM